jgi:hypothetical protein
MTNVVAITLLDPRYTAIREDSEGPAQPYLPMPERMEGLGRVLINAQPCPLSRKPDIEPTSPNARS